MSSARARVNDNLFTPEELSEAEDQARSMRKLIVESAQTFVKPFHDRNIEAEVRVMDWFWRKKCPCGWSFENSVPIRGKKRSWRLRIGLFLKSSPKPLISRGRVSAPGDLLVEYVFCIACHKAYDLHVNHSAFASLVRMPAPL